MVTGRKILLSFSGLPLKPECIKGISQVAVFEYRPRGNPWMGTRCYLNILPHLFFLSAKHQLSAHKTKKHIYNSNQGVGKCAFFRIWTLPSNIYWRLYMIISYYVYIYISYVLFIVFFVGWCEELGHLKILKSARFLGLARWAMLCSWAPLELWRCRCGHLGHLPGAWRSQQFRDSSWGHGCVWK